MELPFSETGKTEGGAGLGEGTVFEHFWFETFIRNSSRGVGQPIRSVSLAFMEVVGAGDINLEVVSG